MERHRAQRGRSCLGTYFITGTGLVCTVSSEGRAGCLDRPVAPPPEVRPGSGGPSASEALEAAARAKGAHEGQKPLVYLLLSVFEQNPQYWRRW